MFMVQHLYIYIYYSPSVDDEERILLWARSASSSSLELPALRFFPFLTPSLNVDLEVDGDVVFLAL
jgi:hypothetical protein